MDSQNQISPPVLAFKSDLPASVVVFLVALPLCLGVALACEMPPAAGLITGIVGGIIVGCFSGSPLQVSGPAAGLTTVVVGVVLNKDLGPAALSVIIILAGFIQILAAFASWGRWFRAVSPAVIHGMLAGIGTLIVLGQIHAMFDVKAKSTGLDNLLMLPESFQKAFSFDSENSHTAAAIIGMATIVALFAWKSLAPGKLQFLPAPLAALIVGTLLANLLPFATKVQKIEVPQNLFKAVILPDSASLPFLYQKVTWISALTVALIASAETLLCAGAVDKMHSGPRTNYNKELAAQGIGNSICGFLGALPMTGVIVRSAANVQAGARTRCSAIFHGVWLLGLAVCFPNLLNLIPKCSLAAVLVVTGFKLVDLDQIWELRIFGRAQVVIYFVTALTIVFSDLLVGVILGLVLSMLHLLHQFASLRVEKTLMEGNEFRIILDGAATFLSLPKLAATLENLPLQTTSLQVDLQNVSFIDHACIELLNSWRSQNESAGRKVTFEWGESRPKYNLGSEHEL